MSAFGLAAYTGPSVSDLSPSRYSAYRAAVRQSVIASVTDQPPTEPTKPPLKPQEQAMAFVKALSVFLPAEMIALYAAFVAAAQPDPKSQLPAVIDLPLWIVALVLSPLLVFALSLWVGKDTQAMRRKKTVVAIPAFALWSASIPASAVYLVPWFRLSQAWVALAFAGTVLVFTYLAKWWVGIRYEDNPDQA